MDDFLITPRTKPAAGVVILFTSRIGGVSDPPYHTLNLSFHIGDEESAVEENRLRLAERLPSPPRWLRQAHGVRVVHADEVETDKDVADASWTDKPGSGLRGADSGLHAGAVPFRRRENRRRRPTPDGADCQAEFWKTRWWKCAARPPPRLVAHIGPCISAPNYPVGDEVREALCVADEDKAAFTAAKGAGKWHADLPALASLRLKRCGIPQVHIHGACTMATPPASSRPDGTGKPAGKRPSSTLSPKD